MPKKAIFCLLIFVFFTLSGCQKNRQSSLDRSIAEYNHGQWLLSKMYAEESINQKQHIGESQYLIGMCEFRRNRVNASKEWFNKSQNSSNPEVKAKSQAMLGIIAKSEGDVDEANQLFAKASTHLRGMDKHHAVAHSNGDMSSSNYSTDFFTLQFGAFRNESNANESLSKLKSTLAIKGISQSWVKSDTDKYGNTLYLVQAGKFVSRNSAATRKKQGDLPQCIIVQSR